MVHLALCIVALAAGYTTAASIPQCCKKKTVGEVPYVLVEEADTMMYGCKSNCVFEKKGNPGSRFCFKEGDLEVDCDGEGAGETLETLETCTCAQNKTEHRIFGANVTPLHPLWQVALVPKISNPQPQYFICGGSLITTQTVVTAAHCLYDKQQKRFRKNDEFLVWVGLLNYNDKNVVKQKVTSIVLYTNWVPNLERLNDIAVLIIDQIPSAFKNFLLITLPPANLALDGSLGRCATASGWGLISQSPDTYPSKLQVLLDTFVTNAVCNQIYQGQPTITKNQICFAAQAGKGACLGDSGGPLVFRIQLIAPSINYLIGVTSFVPTDCSHRAPSVFTRVTSPEYLKFIHKHAVGQLARNEPVSRLSDACIDCC